MKKNYFLCFIVILFYGGCVNASFRFARASRSQSRKAIAAHKVFNYGGGMLITGTTLYYINEKRKQLNLSERFTKEIKRNPAMLKQFNDIAKKGSQVLLCDTYAPIKSLCFNKVTKALYDGILEDSNPKTEVLREKIIQLTIENSKKIAKQGLKYFYLETTEQQKFVCVFSTLIASFITVQAVSSVWKNMNTGRLFLRSNLFLSGTTAVSTLLASMYLDEEKIVSLAADVLEQNQSVIMPIFEQFGYEAKEFGLKEIAKRDAFLLLMFKKSVFDRAMNKVEYLPFKSVDTFMNHALVKDVIADLFKEIIEECYQYTQSSDLADKIIGRMVFGAPDVSLKDFIFFEVKRIVTSLRISAAEQLEFTRVPEFLTFLYEFFTKKEIDESCSTGSSVTIEEVGEEELE